MSYQEFFKQVTGFAPYPWQERLSTWEGEAVAVVAAPTGAGKESGAVIPWLYDHVISKPTTARLIYALPTRSLVDQVYANICKIVDKSGTKILAYCLKGGLIEHGFEQDLTQPAILVGTQDQLLSRALNRGFGVSWGQKPLHCAALTNDCRWVLDEIQLTGVAYKTLVQLYQHWRSFGTFGETQLCLMSATFDDSPLKDLTVERFELDEADRANSFLNDKITRPKPISPASVGGVEDVAALARAKHKPGNLSLVVVNTVARAREIGELLADLEPLVIHSRFLGIDREELQKKLYKHKGLIIATQVVEAGVDLDADLLITELCPWSSLVQRCGRCGRRRTENEVQIYWLDYQQDWQPLPYKDVECSATRKLLLELTDASLSTLAQIPLPDLNISGPYLGKQHIENFFKTSYENRTAASHYVRDSSNFTVSVVWSATRPERLPHQRFVCPVPTKELTKFCQKINQPPYVWGDDAWEVKTPKPGDVVWLPLTAGGYSHSVGWTGNRDDKPEAYSLDVEPQYNDPRFSHNVVLGTHLKDTEAAIRGFPPHLRGFIPHLQRLKLSESLIEELCRCARWHDWGKAHPVWQAYAEANGELLAKSTDYGHWRELKGFRHELASAFAAAKQGAPFLAQYLIAAHHGKVRDSLLPPHHEKQNSRILRGVELGTRLPEVVIEGVETLPDVELAFSEDAEFSWFIQLEELLQEYGPFKLIYLEALIRNADVQASQYREKEAKNDSNHNR